MKGTVIKKASSFIWATLLLGVAIAILLLPGPLSSTAQNASQGPWAGPETFWPQTDHFAIVGTWITRANLFAVPPGFPPDGKFEAIETFYNDGTMQVVSNLPGTTIGAGVWKYTGPNRFTFTFSFYRLDTSGGDPFAAKMLGAFVQENVLITGPNTYITTDSIRPLDGDLTNGATLGFVPGTVTGKRYEFATHNSVLP